MGIGSWVFYGNYSFVWGFRLENSIRVVYFLLLILGLEIEFYLVGLWLLGRWENLVTGDVWC